MCIRDRRSVDRSSFFFHWDYLNEAPILRKQDKDQIGWVVSRIDDPSRSAEISRRIDALFEEADAQTVTMSEKAMQNQFLGMLSAILRALDFVSVVILLIMMLILGNTIAM